MVSSKSILVKSESTSSLPMKSLYEKFTISSAKTKQSFTGNPLNVIEESLETKTFSSL